MRHTKTIFAALALSVTAAHAQLPEPGARGGPLPPVFVPPENPITEPKRVLGKMLFWDEQLSSDNTRSCGSCHIPAFGGTEADPVPHPGPDHELGTEDDKFTSRGIIRSLKDGRYTPDPVFGVDPQATARSATPTVFAAYFGELFWDGRAPGFFVDPETGEKLIPVSGGLETQSLEPILSGVEMAHEGRDWDDVTTKLERSVPLALARDLPPDLAGALEDDDTRYPDLFHAAFGDSEITPARIAMAIATYERTLVPNQSPWDRYVAGDEDAMTFTQKLGWQRFQGHSCVTCHSPPFFTDFNYHNIGVRPDIEDPGRAGVTRLESDRGAFKTSTLRNVGLKRNLMHTGGPQRLSAALDIYAAPQSPDNPNRSIILPIFIPPSDVSVITEFILDALTDPRVENEQFPFDRPTLYHEWGNNPAILEGGVPGSGGLVPRVIVATPPNVGNGAFRIGLTDARPSADAYVAISQAPPEAGVVAPDTLEGPYTVVQSEGVTVATHRAPIPPRPALDGRTVYMQWRVHDPDAPAGLALSRPVRVDYFCNGPCPTDCPADLAEPFYSLDLADVHAFASAFASGDPIADLADPDGVHDLADVAAFTASFTAGCP